MTDTAPSAIHFGAVGAAFRRVGRRWRVEPRTLLSFRWVAIALILLGWFVYYPIVDNFIISTDGPGHLYR